MTESAFADAGCPNESSGYNCKVYFSQQNKSLVAMAVSEEF